MAITYEPIATTTLGSSSAAITFSGIASSWTDLRVIFLGTGSSTVSKRIQFNNDTGTNYSVTKLGGNGTSMYAAGQTSEGTGIRFASDASGDSLTVPVLSQIDILSYAGATNKSVLIQTSSARNNGGYVQLSVGMWRNTSAITTLSFVFANADTYGAGTTVTLYGILRA